MTALLSGSRRDRNRGLPTLRPMPDHCLMLSMSGDGEVHCRRASVALAATLSGQERPKRQRHLLPDREIPWLTLLELARRRATPRPETSTCMRCHFILPLYEPVERSLAESAIRRASVF